MQRPGSASARTLRPRPGRQLDRQEQLSIIHPVRERRPTKPAPEQQVGYRHHRQLAGSSLRVRETSVELRDGWSRLRVIPACAGNMWANNDASRRSPGHPCVCGEQPYTGGCLALPIGSSLHVRGTVAEFTAAVGSACVCGEHASARSRSPVVDGSSLRVRGTVAEFTAAVGSACVCGEQHRAARRKSSECGSSLRVRGTARRDLHDRRDGWVIPACAGNRSARPSVLQTPSGHPCVCGEQRRRGDRRAA